MLLAVSFVGLAHIDSQIRDFKNISQIKNYGNYTTTGFQENPSTINTDRDVEKNRNLLGDKTVHIIFTKSPNIDETKVIDLHNALINDNENIFNFCGDYECAQATSLNYTKTFLRNESKKYGLSDNAFNLNLEIHEKIYELESPVGFKWSGLTFETIYQFEDQFNEILDAEFKNVGLTDPVLFMYYDDSYQEYTNSIFDSEAFRSYAGYSRAFVNINLPTIENSSFITHVFIHEMLHLFDTSDKYIEGGAECKENGLGNESLSFSRQKTTDIMCSIVPSSSESESFFYDVRFGDFRKNEVIINKHTAKELGWLD